MKRMLSLCAAALCLTLTLTPTAQRESIRFMLLSSFLQFIVIFRLLQQEVIFPRLHF